VNAAVAQALLAARQAQIQALARRAATRQGATRVLLEARLQQLRAALGEPAPTPAPPTTPTPAAPPPGAAALTELLAHIARHGPAPQAGAELRAVHEHRATWSRLGVERRITQALARVPDNAGPLNTQRLLHQALTRLHDGAPAYLQRLVTQVEALLALEALNAGAGPATPTRKLRPGPAP
jgi:hypothetical protein